MHHHHYEDALPAAATSPHHNATALHDMHPSDLPVDLSKLLAELANIDMHPTHDNYAHENEETKTDIHSNTNVDDASTLAATLHALSSSQNALNQASYTGAGSEEGDLLQSLLAQLQGQLQGLDMLGHAEGDGHGPSSSLHGKNQTDSTASDTNTCSSKSKRGAASYAARDDEAVCSDGDAPFDELPGMSGLVDTIMKQLLSKDVLYQPMKVR